MSDTKVVFIDYTYDTITGKIALTTVTDLLSPVTEYPFGLDRSCAICLCEFKNLKYASKLPCGHIFDTHCITEWLNEKKICPLCRKGPVSTCPKWLFYNFKDISKE